MSGKTLPVSYPKLPSMVQTGDTIFLGRYLVTGSEESSCFLTVRSDCPYPGSPTEELQHLRWMSYPASLAVPFTACLEGP